MVKKAVSRMSDVEVEALVEEAAVVEVDEELVEKASKDLSKKDANELVNFWRSQHAMVHALLDEQRGGDPTVRSFMKLADEIKALLSV